MKKLERLDEFYRERSINVNDTALLHYNHYNVFKLEEKGFISDLRPATYCKRDFFKIALIRGRNICHYANKSIEIDGPTLMFFNPRVPYTWEPLSDETGFYIIFKELFYNEGFKRDVNSFQMFAPGAKPSYPLTKDQDLEISFLFQKMMQEKQSAYPYKNDLIRNFLNELIHFALKMTPLEKIFDVKNANGRLTAVFLELLNRQLPMDGSLNSALLTAPKEYARELNVHVNHLNRAVKETTGKTTTELIADKLIGEAQILLSSTQLNISEIGRNLGFDDPSHFYVFFKKRVGHAPSHFRAINLLGEV